jgi:hypothetical protein
VYELEGDPSLSAHSSQETIALGVKAGTSAAASDSLLGMSSQACFRPPLPSVETLKFGELKEAGKVSQEIWENKQNTQLSVGLGHQWFQTFPFSLSRFCFQTQTPPPSPTCRASAGMRVMRSLTHIKSVKIGRMVPWWGEYNGNSAECRAVICFPVSGPDKNTVDFEMKSFPLSTAHQVQINSI